MKNNYIFYERDDKGIHIIARLRDNQFTGDKAKDVEEFLIELGYPKKGTPDRLLHGSRMWAAVDSK